MTDTIKGVPFINTLPEGDINTTDELQHAAETIRDAFFFITESLKQCEQSNLNRPISTLTLDQIAHGALHGIIDLNR